MCVSAAETLSSELFNEWRRRYGHAIVEGLGSTEVLHIYHVELALATKARCQRQARARLRASPHDPAGVDVPEGQSGILWMCAGIRRRRAIGAGLTRPPTPCARMGLYRRPLPARRGRVPFLRGTRRRLRQGQRAGGESAGGRAVPGGVAPRPRVRRAWPSRMPTVSRRWPRSSRSTMGRPPTTRRRASSVRFVKARLLPYKYPREVTYLAELPKTGTGKIDRQALKKR
jgi:acyl-CoA synthetase (AMP-forming)/AMP-acid ligase II